MRGAEFVFSQTQWEFIESDAFVDILQGPRGEGKMVRLDELIPTPSGWVKAGDLQPGDSVLAGDGTPTTILGAYYQPAQPLWRLRFSDDTSLVTTDDHLWAVQTGWDRGTKRMRRPSRATGRGRKRGTNRVARQGPAIVTTRTIRERLAAGAWRGGGRWSIPLLSAPAQFESRTVPLDPYLLGVLLGDGGLAHQVVHLTTSDAEIAENVRRALPAGHALARHGDGIEYAITGPRGRNEVLDHLRGLGLMGCRSADKWIPPNYLWNRADVRLALLQGLLDTDGTVLRHSNSVSFSSVSERLAEGVEFLVRSLGGMTRRRIRHTHYTHRGERRAGQPSHHVSIRLPNGVAPFRLTRKAEIVRPKGARNAPRRYIVGCEPAGEGEGVCFRVAHPSHLYVAGEAFIVTHNTLAGIAKILHKASQLPGHARPLRVAVVRDTWINMQRTTMVSLDEVSRKNGLRVKYVNDRTEAILGNGQAQLIFMGFDRLSEISKFQSLEIGCLWIEEPSPAGDISGGLPVELFAVGATSLRQAGVIKPWVQITQNPPDEDHWTITIAEQLRLLQDRFPSLPLTVRWHNIPKGENPWITDKHRQRNELALMAAGRDDLVQRLVEGKVGQILRGEAVMPDYSDTHHVAAAPLPILRNVPVIRLWDFGSTPTCLWTQVTPMGYWHWLWAVQRVNAGIEQLIELDVKPWQAEFMRYHEGGFRDIGDPAGGHPEQRNSEDSAVRLLSEKLRTSFEPGVIAWSERRDALRACLNRNIRGAPLVRVDPEARLIRRAMRGGWHYPKNAMGAVTFTLDAAKRASGLHDHLGHALTYGASRLYPLDSVYAAPFRGTGRQRAAVPAGASWMEV